MKNKLFVIVLLFSSLLLSSCAGRSLPTATAVPTREARISETTTTLSSTEAPETPKPDETATVAGTPYPRARALLETRPARESLIEVEVLLQDVVNLYGVEVHLTFEPAMIDVKDANGERAGVQIVPGEAFVDEGFVALNQVDNDEGAIDFAATLLNPAKPLQDEVKVASFLVEGLAAGSSDIAFSEILLADRQANSLPVVGEGITIDVQP